MTTEPRQSQKSPAMPDVKIQHTEWVEENPVIEGWNRGRRGSRKGSPSRRTRSLTPGKANPTLSQGTLGGTKILLPSSSNMSTQEYCKLVKRRFKNHPAVYQRFVQIIQEMRSQEDSNGRLELVKQLITLFDGQPDLILNINAFLPEEYCIEMQDDAVVIKVFEQFGTASIVDTGHSRAVTNNNKHHSPLPNMGTSVESLGYIVNVKKVFSGKPQVYFQFIRLLEDYHSKKVNELNTIHRVVSLFQTHPELVLGFNEFLPPGFAIHMYENTGYVIEHPNKKEGGSSKMRIMIDNKYK